MHFKIRFKNKLGNESYVWWRLAIPAGQRGTKAGTSFGNFRLQEMKYRKCGPYRNRGG